MKTLILTIMSICLLQCSLFKQSANRDLVDICKSQNDKLRISYIDSAHGIIKINSTLRNDTLHLTIYVSKGQKYKEYLISISNDIKYVSYGDKILIIEDLPTCRKTRSGKEALDYLRGLNK